MVLLTHGINEFEVALPPSGATVAEVAKAYRAMLNLGREVRVFANNLVVPWNYVIRENDQIEFQKPYGQKGLDPFTEEMLTISQAARRLPGLRKNKHPHPNTVVRWGTRGQKSKSGKQVYLETMQIGDTTFTSVEAIRRFFEKLNDIIVESPPSYRQSQLEKQAAEAEKILRERGMIK